MNESITLSLEQAAQFLNVNPKTLYNLTRKQSQRRHAVPIPFLKIGRQVAFRKESLTAWVHQLEQRSTKEK